MDPFRRVTDGALALAVFVACAAVFTQVFCRYVLNDPVSWLDEFAVLAFAWIIMIGAAVVQRTDSHMGIDSFVKPLPARLQALAYVVRLGAIVFTLAVLGWQGWLLAQRMSFIEYPAMEISRGFLFAILPVGAPLMLYYLIRTAIADFRVIRSGGKVFDKPPQSDIL
jgi:TRAP-type transport system small permease protein